MNRTQFWIVTALSGAVALCLLTQIILVKVVQHDQIQLTIAQQNINQGQLCFNRLQQMAQFIGQVVVQTQDPGLKELLARQNIAFAPPANGAQAPAPAPAPAH